MLSITCHNWIGFLRKDGCSNLATWIVMMMMTMMIMIIMMMMTILPVMAMVSCGNQNITYFKICQYNATNILQFSTDISTYYFCICPHQLSMLNVLSTESLSGETTVPSRRDRHRTRYTWRPHRREMESGSVFWWVQCVAAQVHI